MGEAVIKTTEYGDVKIELAWETTVTRHPLLDTLWDKVFRLRDNKLNGSIESLSKMWTKNL